MGADGHGWEKKRSGFRQKAEPFNIQMSAALCRDAATPDGREVLECASPLALLIQARRLQGGRGLPQSKTLPRLFICIHPW